MIKIRIKNSKRTIKYIIIHCSATPEGRVHTAKDIDLWHKQRGFTEIGYNYVILLDGTIEQGRDVDKIPAHVEGHNQDSIGICYIGGIDKNTLQPKDTRTKAQKEALVKLLKELRVLYPNAIIQGHRDFAGVKKACPCFNAKEEYQNI